MVSVHRQGFVIPYVCDSYTICNDHNVHSNDLMYRQSNDPLFDAFENCIFSFENTLSNTQPEKWKGYTSYISNNKKKCNARQTSHTTQNNNIKCGEKRPRIICKYFRIGRCMKGADCEWSHTMDSDYATMDWCQFGTKCERRPGCPFMHIDQADNPEVCERYAAGFCHDGPACSKIHNKLKPATIPDIADIIVKSYDESRLYREGDKRRAEMYKTSMCFAFQKGCCKKGKKKCSFAHGYLDMSPAGVANLKRNEWYRDYENITDNMCDGDDNSTDSDDSSVLSLFSTEHSTHKPLYNDGMSGLMISDTRRVVSLFLDNNGRWMRYDVDNNLIVA